MPHPFRGLVGARDVPLGKEEVEEEDGVDDGSDAGEEDWTITTGIGETIVLVVDMQVLGYLSPLISPVPFPSCFLPLLQTLSRCRALQSQLAMLTNTHPTRMAEHITTVSEFCVLLVAIGDDKESFNVLWNNKSKDTEHVDNAKTNAIGTTRVSGPVDSPPCYPPSPQTAWIWSSPW